MVAFLSLCVSLSAQVKVSGVISAPDGAPIEFASVAIKGSSVGAATNAKGEFSFLAPVGDHVIVASSVGFLPAHASISVAQGKPVSINLTLKTASTEIQEVVVESSSSLKSIDRSAFNAVAIDTKLQANADASVGQALAKAPGIKLRENGGVGSDQNVMLDGFSGKHVKVFIDGVPLEGSEAININNLPANFASRIEVYKGVVPIQFGTDAIGGVINVVSNRQQRGWHLDASYTYGSFNTHKSFVDFGLTSNRGSLFSLRLLQNYSDNDYKVNVAVEDFSTGVISRSRKRRVSRFHDVYHNEAAVFRAGVVIKP